MIDLNLKTLYTGHPLRESETWEDFYSSFGFELRTIEPGIYGLYESNEVVTMMVPYKYYDVKIKVHEEIEYFFTDELNYIFHLMYDKLLCSRKKNRLLPARKLGNN